MAIKDGYEYVAMPDSDLERITQTLMRKTTSHGENSNLRWKYV
jgi:hypothetical protein